MKMIEEKMQSGVDVNVPDLEVKNLLVFGWSPLGMVRILSCRWDTCHMNQCMFLLVHHDL